MPEQTESELSQLVSAVRVSARKARDAHREHAKDIARLDDFLTEHASGFRIEHEEVNDG